MALSYTTAVRNARLQEVADAIDAGSAAGEIKIYSGSVPANVGASLGAATLLATLILSNPAAASITGGVLTFDTITSDTNVAASGTASFFRVTDSDDAAVVQGTVAETSGGDINFDDTAFVAGGTAAISSLTITTGNA